MFSEIGDLFFLGIILKIINLILILMYFIRFGILGLRIIEALSKQVFTANMGIMG